MSYDKVKKIFYSDEFGMRGFPSLWAEVKKQNIDIGYSKLKEFYQKQEVVQMFAPLKKPKISKVPITGNFVGEKVYMDTMYFHKQKVAILNGIDLYSKYAWGHAHRLKTRADETVESIGAVKALTFLKEVVDNLEEHGYTLESIVTDSGSEFLAGFHTYLEEHDIPHRVTDVGDHLQLAPIDAYTRGFRLSCEKWITVNPTGDLYKMIPTLIETYNARVQSSIKIPPKEAYEKENVEKRSKSDGTNKADFNVGDTVRISIRLQKNPMKKIRANWSKELYTIKKVNPTLNQYELSNGKRYRDHDLYYVKYPDKIVHYTPHVPETVVRERVRKEREVPEKRKTRYEADLDDWFGL